MAIMLPPKLVFVLVVVGPCVSLHDREPICTSRFDFEEKLLHKMVKMEHAMDLLKDAMNKQIVDLEKEKSEISEIRDLMIKEKAEVLDQMTDIRASVKNYFDDVNKTLKTLQDEYVSAITSKVAPIVFSVTEPKLEGGTVTFKKVLSNEGNAYDVTNGKFTCPVDGIYSFSFTIRSSSRGYVWCDIRKNGKRLNYAISEGINDLGSITIHQKLNSGDIIDIGNCENWRNSAGSPTTFSGYLLHTVDNLKFS